jgi:hypothetical protein
MPAVKTCILLLFLVSALSGCGSGSTSNTQTSAPGASATSVAAKAPDENAALDTLRKISEAQSTYFKINRRYALAYDELIEAHFLNNEPGAAQTGYEFKLRPAADAQTYKISATPADSSTAARHFFMDQTGAIHAETGKDATADSAVVK